MKPLTVRESSRLIDLNDREQDKPFIIVASHGSMKYAELPHHGETKVITHQGQVKRIRFDEGEEF
ncbi:XtrA/YqaO family protein [Litoribacterium kuwaitense]|uniref:XtrA/YqaO family protein n=1 Tax=Litoribacterium kuwaitense TaxID=1398745 RepID=UPI0035E46731